MTHKRVILRALADRDVHEAVDFYLGEGSAQSALKFVDALEQALRHIERHPASGSSRYSNDLDLPGLRCWQLKGYPHLLFYVEGDNHVDVWRLLHGSRDIPPTLQVPA